jgi:hypothetical protein
MPTAAPTRTTRLLAVIGPTMAAASFYLVSVDDAPGAPVAATLVTTAGLALVLRARRPPLARRVAWTAIAGVLILAAVVSFRLHIALLTAPLAPTAADLPSTVGVAPTPELDAAVSRARPLLRGAAWTQHLPGVSVAVGRDGTVVWTESVGWRDLATRTPVTAATRFAIGTATSAVQPVTATLALADTSVDDAGVWSPEHIGEPEEDFPGFRMVREAVFTPLGLVHPQPLPGNRATFYVPRSNGDPRLGRRLMAMRDLACCANGRTFASTPSDLVRFAMAARPGPLDGVLAGGPVMSIATGAGGLVVVAVASNIAHADTPALARQIAETFARGSR